MRDEGEGEGRRVKLKQERVELMKFWPMSDALSWEGAALARSKCRAGATSFLVESSNAFKFSVLSRCSHK